MQNAANSWPEKSGIDRFPLKARPGSVFKLSSVDDIKSTIATMFKSTTAEAMNVSLQQLDGNLFEMKLNSLGCPGLDGFPEQHTKLEITFIRYGSAKFSIWAHHRGFFWIDKEHEV